MLYWDITTEVELRLLVKRSAHESVTTRVYTSKMKERTYVYPSASLIEKALSASVVDVMGQIQSDDIWNELVPDTKYPPAEPGDI